MSRFSFPALSRSARRAGGVLATCLAAASMVSCGGGTQAKRFVPESFVVFGDDFALIKTDSARYNINTYRTGSTSTYTCNSQVSWVMLFAFDLGFKFPNECPDWNAAGEKTAVMLANDPTTVGLSATEIDTAVAHAGANAVLTTIQNNRSLFNDKALVTVSVGRADIVKAYFTYLETPDAATLSSLTSQLKTLGAGFAAGLKPVVTSGARMMVVLTPNLGESPLAKSDASNLTRNKDALSTLSNAFNDGLTFALTTNGYTGQQVALVDVPRAQKSVLASYASYGYSDIDTSACPSPQTVAPLCEVGTLTDAATVLATYFWADPTHLSVAFDSTIASTTYSAFQNHPF